MGMDILWNAFQFNVQNALLKATIVFLFWTEHDVESRFFNLEFFVRFFLGSFIFCVLQHLKFGCTHMLRAEPVIKKN